MCGAQTETKMNKNELTVSELKAMHFADDALMLSPYPLYRYTHKGRRYYYYIDPADAEKVDAQDKLPVHFAAGVTTITGTQLPKDEYLIKWIADMGYDNAIAYRDHRAKYGSLMHTCIASLMIKRVFNLDLLDEVVTNYAALNQIAGDTSKWADELRQDVLAFAQFMRDYKVKPLAIEMSLVNPLLGVAGTLDILCTMTIQVKGFWGEVYKQGENKGEPKETKQDVEVLAIVDNKSGRNSTGGESNAAQLKLLKMLLRSQFEQFTEREIKLYNWHPKNWRTRPDYTLVDQTDNFSDTAALNLINLYKERQKDPDELTALAMYGVVDLDNDEVENYSVTQITSTVQQAVNDGQYKPEEYDYLDKYFTENYPIE